MKKICLIILFLFSLGSIIGLRKGVTPTASADSAPAETVEVITITPTIDTFLNMSPGASAPAPDGQFFFVGADEFTYEAIGLIQFDLSQIPAEAVIESAQLTLSHDSSQSTNSLARIICVKQITSSWNAAVTTSNVPAIHEFCHAQREVAFENGNHTWSDLGQLVQGWVIEPTMNFGLALDLLENGYGYKAFHSADSANPPTLEITYTVPDTTKFIFLPLVIKE